MLSFIFVLNLKYEEINNAVLRSEFFNGILSGFKSNVI